MNYKTLIRILFVSILAIILFNVTKKLYAQDIPCYEEVYRYKSVKGYYGGKMIANYKHNWLYKLVTYKDSCSIFLYKENDTLHKSIQYHKYRFKLGITKDGNCFLVSYLNDIKNIDGTCTISLLDSNLTIKNTFNIKAIDYTPELYSPLKYLNIRGDTIMMKKSYLGGGGLYYFTENELTVKYYNPLAPNYLPHYYDFGQDSMIYFKSYQERDKADVMNDNINYIRSENYTEKFNSIEDIFGKKQPFPINIYTTFIENGIVTQLENGDVVFYKFCD